MEKNKFAVCISAFLCLAMFCMIGFQVQQRGVKVFAMPATTAKAAVLIEANTGRVLYEKNQHKSMPMASTTKIMTAYSVLKRTENLDTPVEVSPLSVGIEGTSMYLKKGDVYTIKDLLKGMMLASGNDASVALALHFSESVEEFAKIMTQDAKQLGLKNTSFSNPHGLDQNGHYTSAYDLAIIASNAMKFDFFKQLVSKKSDLVSPVNNPDGKMQLVVNKNRLLGNYSPATGIKIGFTDDAGRCLVSSASKDGLNLIAVVLNCYDMFAESKKLLEYGFDNYVYTQLLQPYKVHRSLEVKSGRDKGVKIYTKQQFCFPLTPDESLQIEHVLEVPSQITAPIEKEEVVGTYKIFLKDNLIFSTTVYALDKVKSIQLHEFLKDIAYYW